VSVLIYPSLLAADFSHLKDEIESVEKAGAHGIHFDVMDGHFVPNLSFGAPVLKCISSHIQGEVDCHLMVENPLELIEDFVKAGAERITIHVESSSNIQETLEKINSFGVRAGISVKPKTPISEIEKYLDLVDLVLVMTVEPGFGGQKLIPSCLEKLQQLKELFIKKNKEKILLQVDGGINKQTASLAIQAGADVLVAGSAIFKEKDYAQAMKELLL